MIAPHGPAHSARKNMSPWLDDQGRLFNPAPRLQLADLSDGRVCVVIDDVLANPQGLADWAAQQRFQPPNPIPYPGLLLPAPAEVAARTADFFALHVRKALGGRRTLDASVRLAIVCQPPETLSPVQWQCHRDRLQGPGEHLLFAASVLYLFRDPALGGTSFYRPRRPMAEIERMVADSQRLDGAAFAQRWGVQPGYMLEGNAHFERVARVPAKWNRMILYDGGQFHSGDVGDASRLTADAASGRLTLNGFFTCRRLL